MAVEIQIFGYELVTFFISPPISCVKLNQNVTGHGQRHPIARYYDVHKSMRLSTLSVLGPALGCAFLLFDSSLAYLPTYMRGSKVRIFCLCFFIFQSLEEVLPSRCLSRRQSTSIKQASP
jgi:hypothetical protein